MRVCVIVCLYKRDGYGVGIAERERDVVAVGPLERVGQCDVDAERVCRCVSHGGAERVGGALDELDAYSDGVRVRLYDGEREHDWLRDRACDSFV